MAELCNNVGQYWTLKKFKKLDNNNKIFANMHIYRVCPCLNKLPVPSFMKFCYRDKRKLKRGVS